MKHLAAPLVLASCIALMTIPAFTQAPADEQAAKPKATRAAYVYAASIPEIGNHTTIFLYDADSAGKVKPVGSYTLDRAVALIGSNGKYMIASDAQGSTANLWVYAVKSNGAIGELVSTANGAEYISAECGNPVDPEITISSAKLDHTGKYLYVRVYANSGVCSAWESYEIGSNGNLTFLGVTPGTAAAAIDTISSIDTLAYGELGDGAASCVNAPYGGNQFSAYRRDSAGVLEPNLSFTHIDPTPDPSPGDSNNNFYPTYTKADPAGHLAVLVEDCLSSSVSGADIIPIYLASYTIDKSTGSIKSTNTWKDMPTTEANGTARDVDSETSLELSPSGKYLTAYVGGAVGFQVFHFNGAAPITPLTKLIPGSPEKVGWDKNDHLYVSDGINLRVYAVDSNRVTELSDTKYPNYQFGMLLVPKL